MAPEFLLSIADAAVQNAVRLSRLPYWRNEDLIEAKQTAIVAILEAEHSRPDAGRNYFFIAARNRIVDWQIRLIRDRRTFSPLAAPTRLVTATPPQYTDEDHALTERLLSRLPELRPQLPARDLEYLRMVLTGFTVREIAVQLGLRSQARWRLHLRLIGRLERIASG